MGEGGENGRKKRNVEVDKGKKKGNIIFHPHFTDDFRKWKDTSGNKPIQASQVTARLATFSPTKDRQGSPFKRNESTGRQKNQGA